MTDIQVRLCERLKGLGYARQNQVRLYGLEFELVSDPLVMSDSVVFVDGVEKKSGQFRRVLIPLTVVKIAVERSGESSAA